MSIEEELGKMIQKAAIDGVLNEKAVEHYSSILKENAGLTTVLNKKMEECERVSKERNQANKMFQETHERLAEYLNREEELAERESAAEVLQMTVKYEQKRVEDHKEMVGLIFRNTMLKKQVMTPLEPGQANKYNSCPPSGFAQMDEVEETET